MNRDPGGPFNQQQYLYRIQGQESTAVSLATLEFGSLKKNEYF